MVCAGPPTACTPAANSQCNSITDAVMSLPDLLRARSAQLVGSLELGAPLGRGSFGKVYKGVLPSFSGCLTHVSYLLASALCLFLIISYTYLKHAAGHHSPSSMGLCAPLPLKVLP